MSLTGSDRMNITKYTGMADKSGTYTSHFGVERAHARPAGSTAHGAFSEHYTISSVGSRATRTNKRAHSGIGPAESPRRAREYPRGPVGGRQWLGEPTQKSSIMGSILAIQRTMSTLIAALDEGPEFKYASQQQSQQQQPQLQPQEQSQQRARRKGLPVPMAVKMACLTVIHPTAPMPP